ncbi:hypothetical protein C7S13_0194 [Burkholderia cepacia]|nr:hypothetical protein [Burkholderia cepacia]
MTRRPPPLSSRRRAALAHAPRNRVPSPRESASSAPTVTDTSRQRHPPPP